MLVTNQERKMCCEMYVILYATSRNHFDVYMYFVFEALVLMKTDSNSLFKVINRLLSFQN